MAEEIFRPWMLQWDEVDPRRIPFDVTQVAATVSTLGPAAAVPVPVDTSAGDQAYHDWLYRTAPTWADEMDRALADRYGPWVRGWRMAQSDGGPVHAWCCAGHSITTPDETPARVAAAVVEWREWLEDLAGRFDRFPFGDGMSEQELRHTWERSAAHLVTVVVDRTEAYDAWYGTCTMVLTWYLSRWGLPRDRAWGLVDEAVSGRFRSWATPAMVTVDEVAARLAETLSGEE